jgi:hypothetical protein
MTRRDAPRRRDRALTRDEVDALLFLPTAGDLRPAAMVAGEDSGACVDTSGYTFDSDRGVVTGRLRIIAPNRPDAYREPGAVVPGRAQEIARSLRHTRPEDARR